MSIAQYRLKGFVLGTACFTAGELTFYEAMLEIIVGDDDGNFTTPLELELDSIKKFRIAGHGILQILAPFDVVSNWAANNSMTLDSSQPESICLAAELGAAERKHFRDFIVPALTKAHYERSISRLSNSLRETRGLAASTTSNVSAADPQQQRHDDENANADGGDLAPSKLRTSSSAPTTVTAPSPTSPAKLPSPIHNNDGPAINSPSSEPRKQESPPSRRTPRDDDDDDDLTIGSMVLQRRKKAPRLEKAPGEATDAAYDFTSVMISDVTEKTPAAIANKSKSAKSNKKDAAKPTIVDAMAEARRKASAAEGTRSKREPSKAVKKSAEPSNTVAKKTNSTTTKPLPAVKNQSTALLDPKPIPRVHATLKGPLPQPHQEELVDRPVIRSPTFLHRPDMVVMPTPKHGNTAAADTSSKGKGGKRGEIIDDAERQQVSHLKSLLDDGLRDDDNFDSILKHITILAKAKREARARQEKSRMKIDGGELARCVSQVLSRVTQESQIRRKQVTAYYVKRYDDAIAEIQTCKEVAQLMQEQLAAVRTTVDKTLGTLTQIKERMGLDMQRWDNAELMDCTAATASIQQKLLQLPLA